MRLFTTLHQSSFGGELVYRRRGSGGASTGGCTHVSTFSQSFMPVRIEVENNPTLHKSLERFITEETLLVRGCGCCWLWLLLAVAVAGCRCRCRCVAVAVAVAVCVHAGAGTDAVTRPYQLPAHV